MPGPVRSAPNHKLRTGQGDPHLATTWHFYQNTAVKQIYLDLRRPAKSLAMSSTRGNQAMNVTNSAPTSAMK